MTPGRASPRAPASRRRSPVAAASHAPISTAAQSCSPPPNGTNTPPPASVVGAPEQQRDVRRALLEHLRHVGRQRRRRARARARRDKQEQIHVVEPARCSTSSLPREDTNAAVRSGPQSVAMRAFAPPPRAAPHPPRALRRSARAVAVAAPTPQRAGAARRTATHGSRTTSSTAVLAPDVRGGASSGSWRRIACSSCRSPDPAPRRRSRRARLRVSR